MYIIPKDEACAQSKQVACEPTECDTLAFNLKMELYRRERVNLQLGSFEWSTDKVP